ncbi:hypothetical protein Sjap_017848 [Stephania japonica]|uniref:Uncharacterized protein n=1 Tax=Stephania japonica TaxID=461633 RepID=A0AAP0I731_9MAGN
MIPSTGLLWFSMLRHPCYGFRPLMASVDSWNEQISIDIYGGGQSGATAVVSGDPRCFWDGVEFPMEYGLNRLKAKRAGGRKTPPAIPQEMVPGAALGTERGLSVPTPWGRRGGINPYGASHRHLGQCQVVTL